MHKGLNIFILLWALQMMWSALCWGKGFIVLLDFTTTKKKNLWAECFVKYFLWFLRNHFLFSALSCPPGFGSCCSLAALLNLWCSFPAHLRCFHNGKTGWVFFFFTTWLQSLALSLSPFPFSLLPSFCFCSQMNMTHWLPKLPIPRQGFDHTESSLSLENDMLFVFVLSCVLFLLPGMLFHHYHLPYFGFPSFRSNLHVLFCIKPVKSVSGRSCHSSALVLIALKTHLCHSR